MTPLTCLPNMVNFGPLAASLGHPSTFQLVSRLGSVTARHSSSGHQPNFAALNRGHHLYLSGWPSCWALAHISRSEYLLTVCIVFSYQQRTQSKVKMKNTFTGQLNMNRVMQKMASTTFIHMLTNFHMLQRRHKILL